MAVKISKAPADGDADVASHAPMRHSTKPCSTTLLTCPPSWRSGLGLDRRHNDWPKVSDRCLKTVNDNLPSVQLEKLYSLREVEDSWGISYSTLLREIEDGKLIATKVRGQWRVSTSRLAEYRTAREQPLRLPGHRRTRRNDS